MVYQSDFILKFAEFLLAGHFLECNLNFGSLLNHVRKVIEKT
jgi:hypothetical protein